MSGNRPVPTAPPVPSENLYVIQRLRDAISTAAASLSVPNLTKDQRDTISKTIDTLKSTLKPLESSEVPQAQPQAPPQAKKGEEFLKSMTASSKPSTSESSDSKHGNTEPPSPWFFMLYAILIPAAPLAQLFAGDNYNALSRFMYLTIIPLGFIMYAISIFADYWQLFLNPAELVLFGTNRRFPFTVIGMDENGHAPRISGNIELKPCPSDNFLLTLTRMVLSVVKYFFPQIATTIERILGIGEQVVSKAIIMKDTAVKAGTAAAQIATKLPQAAAGLANPQALQDLAKKQGAIGKIAEPIQSGGGGGGGGILEYATMATLAAVVGGGMILAVGRSLNDEGQNDSPPHPRDV